MSIVITVKIALIVCYLLLSFFSFNRTCTGTTGQQNWGVGVHPVWESQAGLLGAGADTHEHGLIIVAACYNIAAWIF